MFLSLMSTRFISINGLFLILNILPRYITQMFNYIYIWYVYAGMYACMNQMLNTYMFDWVVKYSWLDPIPNIWLDDQITEYLGVESILDRVEHFSAHHRMYPYTYAYEVNSITGIQHWIKWTNPIRFLCYLYRDFLGKQNSSQEVYF